MAVQYRLTSAGWSAIHRSGFIAVCALLISTLSFATAIMGRLPFTATPSERATDRALATNSPRLLARPFQYAIVRNRFPSLTDVPDLILIYR